MTDTQNSLPDKTSLDLRGADWYRERKDRLDQITHDLKEIEAIMLRIAGGETLTQIARDLDVEYIHLSRFLRSTDELAAQLKTAEETRDMARKDGVTQVFDEMTDIDPIHAYTPEGALKPLADIPEGLRRSIAEIETREERDSNGNTVGHLKKIKFYNRLAANERRGKALGMFTDRVQMTGDLGLTGLSESQLDQMIAKEIARLPVDVLTKALLGLPVDVRIRISDRLRDEIQSAGKKENEQT